MSNSRFFWLMIVLAGLLVFLQYRLWLEPGGIRDMLRLKKALASQTVDIEKQKKQNQVLLFQVQRLQNSKDAVEARARNELGMIRKDEKFYQIVNERKGNEDSNQ